ncbi:methyltransferase domain-containing protein [Amycolatopsis sp. OK19-0408]|uniref:Protein-L-isoaspartate O-methyltransferase n=1 Tax=Amycolatopsis iheyensis TaxID=2945988 RepID=A0A9X2SQB8_9PSEU|nr:methyltransferase domain-containing protein [Amycolatopsis iheyensis]MCR6488380.1 methyltransferase domain-containing protein [Amycolatopsis iheyensis]
MDALDTGTWEARAAALADELVFTGVLADRAWHAAFAATPRHLFVPRILDGAASLGAGDPGWLDAVYSDEALATQTRPAGDTAAGREIASSSSSKPTVMAVMLERLGVEPGHRVLEIGTGTGYNAALLSHRLGADNVYTLDLDPELVDMAHEHLTAAGYSPHLAAGDGYQGWPGEMRFDRIIATCAVTAIPPAWIDQLADGGRIVAPLDAGAAGPLLVLDKTADDEVSGRIDPFPVLFMPMRADVTSPFAADHEPPAAATGIPHYGTTAVDPATLLNRPELALFLWLHAPGLRLAGSVAHGVVVAERGPARAEVDLTPLTEGTWAVRQSGPYRLWDTIEHAATAFNALGKPDAVRLGVTALNLPGKQFVWLDDPDSDYSWPLGIST